MSENEVSDDEMSDYEVSDRLELTPCNPQQPNFDAIFEFLMQSLIENVDYCER